MDEAPMYRTLPSWTRSVQLALLQRKCTVKSLHGFLTGRSVIVSMDLKDIDVIGAKALKTCVNSFKNVLSAQSLLVRIGVRRSANHAY